MSSAVAVAAPAPPVPELHPALCAKLLAAARAAPGGWVCRGRWVAVTKLQEPWTTAMVHLEGVPEEAVFETARFAAYARLLHALLLRAYAERGLGLPPWRSWAAISRRWPPLAPAQQSQLPPPVRVHALRPLAEPGGLMPAGPSYRRTGTRPIPIAAHHHR